MTCKNCIHYDVCHVCEMSDCDIPYNDDDIYLCEDFKDRSLFVELPCKIGDKIYDVRGAKGYGYKIVPLDVTAIALIGQNGFEYVKKINSFGKTVFVTYEEAESELKKRNK